MPALAKALDHVDPRVRIAAAGALGACAGGAHRALPALRSALRGEDPEVCLAAGEALARIAAALQFSQATRDLPAVEETLAALEAMKTGGLNGEQASSWAASVEQVRTAVRALRAVRRAQGFDRLLHTPWALVLAGGLAYAGTLLAVWFVLLWLRPLILFRINSALHPLPRLRLPALLGGMEVSPRALFLVAPFHYHRRVLDAWVACHVETFRANFLARPTVRERAAFVPVPVVLDGAAVPALTPGELARTFGRPRACLRIWGEGGAGKTTLACQVARWAMAADPAERLCPHVMLPVLIEHEFDPRTADDRPACAALFEAVRGQLQALIGEAAPLPAELLERLLFRQRILVIVDHLSEVGPAARAAVRPGHADFPAHALVVTSRAEEVLDGVPRTALRPLRIEGNRLSSFMEAYLVQRGKRDLFDDAEYFEACRRLSLLAGPRPITPLLVKLYAEQVIARKEGGPEAALPATLPDLVLGYLNELNRAVPKDRRRPDFEVRHDAQALAWECLRRSFRPGPAGLEDAVAALGADDAPARLEYLEEQLRVIRIIEPARDRVAFTLDPLAEYLAALHLVTDRRADRGFWRGFASQAAALRAEQGRSDGFLLAVRECCRERPECAGVLSLLDGDPGRAA